LQILLPLIERKHLNDDNDVTLERYTMNIFMFQFAFSSFPTTTRNNTSHINRIVIRKRKKQREKLKRE
jgi:hypothetical protein